MKSLSRALCGLIIASLVSWTHARQPAPKTPQSQPSTQSTPEQQRRFDELIALIEGQNTPQARRTGARELLRQGWPSTPQRLAAILSGSDSAARSAVAWALSDLPEHIDVGCIDPLVGMLADSEAGVRSAAAAALAADRTGTAIPKLRGIALDAKRPLELRRTVVETLATIIDRDGMAVLVELLGDPNDELRNTALRALERAAGQKFTAGVDSARQWWRKNRDLPLEQWQRRQIETLLKLQEQLVGERSQILSRLVKAFRDAYLRTDDAKRGDLLAAYLTDEAPAVRLLALELVQSQTADRKPLTPQVTAGVRARLTDVDVRVRRAAVSIVAGFRDPADAAAFLARLAAEPQPTVRIGLINGLGFIGDSGAVDSLLKLMSDASEPIMVEAVMALGRLAERKALGADKKESVAAALLSRYQSVPGERVALREALLRAMGRLADARFADVFKAALISSEPAGIRQAAAVGIDAIGDPKNLAGLAAVVGDSDLGLRRTAVATFSRLGASDNDLQALWGRLAQSSESNAQVRDAAWAGVVRILSGRPAQDIVSWVARLPDDGKLKATRALELLQAAEKTLAATPAARGELGGVRADIAVRMIVLGRVDDAVETYLKGLQDLHAVKSPDIPRVSLDLLRFALTHDRYDQRIAEAFVNGNPPLDGAAVWTGIKDEIDKRVAPDSVDLAIRMIAALQARPPTSMPADAAKEMAAMLARARAMRADIDAKAVRAAVAALRANPADANARATITKLGATSAAILKETLTAIISAEKPDAAAEKLFHDLLESVAPKWPGFAPDASKEDKLKAVAAAGP